jgi:hypothetical protein
VQAIYADDPGLKVEVADRDCLDAPPLQVSTLTAYPLSDLPEDIRQALESQSPLPTDKERTP